MNKLLAAVVGSVLTLLIVAGGPAVWWWDRRPPNVPAPITFHVLFFHPKFAFPPSLKAQLALANLQRDQAVANERTLTAALNRQNAAVRALAAAGAGLRADAARAATAYGNALAHLSKPEARIIAAGSGPGDVCVRARAVDDAFLRSLQ